MKKEVVPLAVCVSHLKDKLYHSRRTDDDQFFGQKENTLMTKVTVHPRTGSKMHNNVGVRTHESCGVHDNVVSQE